MLKIKKILSLAIFVIISLSLFTLSVYGVNEDTAESGKSEEGFSESRVLVVIDRDESLKFNDYSIRDFSEVDCIKITDLTADMKSKTESAVKEGNSGDISFNRILCLELREHGKDKVLDAIEKLRDNEHIVSAAPDYTMKVCMPPNDTYYGQQWGCEKIGLPEAWDATTGSSAVLVGVIDTGIDGTHSDLSGKISTGLCRNFLSGSAVSEIPPTDPYGHGTHVAGIIGARGNNSKGISGVCWNVRLVSLKAFGIDGNGYSSSVISAISFAESVDIEILNLSASWDMAYEEIASHYDSPLYTAFNNYSGLIVCSAGNNNKDVDLSTNHIYPPCYDCSNMIVVGASTASDTKASYSNYGTTSVDIFAPGSDILSTYPAGKCTLGTHVAVTHYSNGYHYDSGTSMAAPFVTGTAALIKSCHPDITVGQLKHAIINYGDYCLSLSGYCGTGRRLNVSKSLEITHNYTYTNIGNDSYHECECSICGYIVNKPHRWTESHAVLSADENDSRYIPQYRCTDCGAVTLHPLTSQSDTEIAASADFYTASTDLGVYYGNFSGCDVYFRGGCLDVLTRIPVGDYVFGYPNSACLTVYKDGRSCDISEAYGRGMLSDSDIAELHDIHKAYLAKDGIDAELYERCE